MKKKMLSKVIKVTNSMFLNRLKQYDYHHWFIDSTTRIS